MKFDHNPLRRQSMLRVAGALFLAGVGTAGVSIAADVYPSKPIKIIVGFPAGQGTDTIARSVAPKLQEILGQTLFVDNRAGAAGIIGQQATATSPPDGYTILLTSAGPMAVNPGVYEKLPYDPIKDYVALGGVAVVPLVMVADPKLGLKSMSDLIALARSKPGEINFASSGNGVTNHLAMEMFSKAAGIKMTHVPYKGSPGALTDLMGSRVAVMFDTPLAVLPFIQSGKLTAIGVSSEKRLGALPDVPTVSESGFPGFSAVSWMAFMAPAKTPPEVVARLNTAITQVVALPEMHKYFAAQGVEPMPMTSVELATFVKSEVDKWGKAARSAGARVE